MRRRQGSGHWVLSPLCSQCGGLRTVPCRCRTMAPCAMCRTWAQLWLYSPWAQPTNKLTFSGQPWAGLLLVTGRILHWPTLAHHQPGRESRLSIVCVTAGPGAGCTTPSAIISYVHHIQHLTLQVIGGGPSTPFRFWHKRPCRKRVAGSAMCPAVLCLLLCVSPVSRFLVLSHCEGWSCIVFTSHHSHSQLRLFMPLS